MPNFISQDDIEAAIMQHLEQLYGYDSLNCFTADPSDPAELNDDSGRTNKRNVIAELGAWSVVEPARRSLPLSTFHCSLLTVHILDAQPPSLPQFD